MAAKEKDATRKAELIAIAETCEWVPEHPARNLREAIQCHFFCHICAELEQVGCGYSEAYLGQNLEPFYQADKAAGLITYDDASSCSEPRHQAERDRLLLWREGRLAELRRPGTEHHPGGYTEDGDDATAEMDYVILDACGYLQLPQPPLTCALHGADERQVPGEGPRCHRHRCGHASVRQRRCDDEAGPQSIGDSERKGITLGKPGAPVSAPAWEATSPTRPVTRWKGSPTWARSSS
jgi:hypothetical protein